MRAIRTALNLAPKTQDSDYECRKKELEALHIAMDDYASAMEKVKANVQVAVQSLDKVRKVFERMAAGESVPRGTRNLVKSFSAALGRVSEEYLSAFTASMDQEVIPAALDMSKLTDECAQYQSKRNKAMREYDIYRNEVAKKESEYAKKNKDLTTSRGYSSDVAKRDELEKKFHAADAKFKSCHSFIQEHTGELITRCMDSFFSCNATFTKSITAEFDAFFGRFRAAEETPTINMNESMNESMNGSMLESMIEEMRSAA